MPPCVLSGHVPPKAGENSCLIFIKRSIIVEQMEITFAAPAKPWSTNEDRTMHFAKRAERIAEWKDAAMLHFISHCNKNKLTKAQRPSLVWITIPFKQKRRRDPHNYCGTVVKAIIDGLVRGGAWDDDTVEYVRHVEPTLTVDPKGLVIVRLETLNVKS